MKTTGTIQKITDEHIIVKVYKQPECKGCSACSEQEKSRTIKLKKQKNSTYNLNEDIEFEVNDKTILNIAFVVYLLPAIFMIIFYYIGFSLFNQESLSIISSFVGILFSIVIIIFLNKKFHFDSNIKTK